MSVNFGLEGSIPVGVVVPLEAVFLTGKEGLEEEDDGEGVGRTVMLRPLMSSYRNVVGRKHQKVD